MRIGLIGPNFEENLSLRYISSSLRSAGFETGLIAFNTKKDIDTAFEQARDYDIIGLSMTFQARAKEYLKLAEMLKKDNPYRPVIAGGHFASCAAENLLRDYEQLDVIVIHEGELTMVELVKEFLSRKRDFKRIKGIAYRDNKDIIFTEKREIIDDLDALPWPDRSGAARLVAGIPTAYMLGSRGCFGECTYCCITTLHKLAPGKRFRQRSVSEVVKEMKYLYNVRGIRQFVFHDDNFLVPSETKNLERISELSEELAGNNINDIGLVIKCRPNDITEEVLIRLKRLGLLRIFMGIETSTETGLASFRRPQSVEDSERALRLCEKLDISSQFNILLFHPDADISTVERDMEFMERFISHPFNFCRTEIYAGTPLEKRMIDENRAYGSYMGRNYYMKDELMQRLWEYSYRLFRNRCLSTGNLMSTAIGIDHVRATLSHFHCGKEVKELSDEVMNWLLSTNRNTVSFLRRLVELVTGEQDKKRLEDRFSALAAEEEKERLMLLSEGISLRTDMENLSLRLVGLKRKDGRLFRLSKSISRHAAAVMIALGIAGVACSESGSSEMAPDVISDIQDAPSFDFVTEDVGRPPDDADSLDSESPSFDAVCEDVGAPPLDDDDDTSS